jgi:APA family basic amino acid/polyamine antiporter
MAAEQQKIEARLSTFDTTMVVFSLVVGIGIFRTPSIVARAAGSTPVFFAAWAIGGLISLLGALTFAEIGSRHPRAGGYYRVVADCYHPGLAFMLNWAQTLMQGAGAAGVAFIGADYLAPLLLPTVWQTPHASLALACALMLLLLLLNFLGIRAGARTQNLLSMVKILMIVGLAALALALAPHAATVAATIGVPPVTRWEGRLAAALVSCFYAYGGYQMTMNLGADVKDARRGFPLAVTVGMLCVVALYLLINLAYQRTLGMEAVADSRLVAAALSRAVFGPSGEAVVSIAIFLSAAGFVNATILQMPRSLYAMAEDGVLPRAFLRVNPATQVQEVGLLFFGATMLLPALLLGSFEKLLNYVLFTDALTLVVVASTLFILRRRQQGEGGFRMPGYPLLPGLFILCLLGVAAHILAFETRLALVGVAIMLSGWPLFRLGRKLLESPGSTP